jgi:hypothetical protein
MFKTRLGEMLMIFVLAVEAGNSSQNERRV